MTFKKYYFPLAIFLVFTGMQLGYSQQEWKASIGGQFSFSELKVSDNQFISSGSRPSIGLNLGISRALNQSWSIHSGIDVSYVQTGTSILNYSDSVAAVDMEGEDFEFRYQLKEYSEQQESMLLSIPIALQYESNGSQTRFYSKLGASVNVFINPTTEGSASNLTTSGYFERFNGVLTAPRFAGFGTFDEIEFAESDLDIKNSFNVFLEIGIKENFESGWVYLGFFAEYGLNNLLESNNSSLIEYNQNRPLDFINNSSLNSSRGTNNPPLFDKLNLNVIGLRIKYEFSI